MNSGVKKEGYETDLESEGKESKEMRTDFRRGCDGGGGRVLGESREKEETGELEIDQISVGGTSSSREFNQAGGKNRTKG